MSLLSPNFLIGQIRIGTVSDASCVNLGNNLPTQFESHKKQNQGFGSITGDHNDIEDIRNLLDDADLIDMFQQMDNEAIPDWIKTLINEQIEEKAAKQKPQE
ncbi:hypothetical protein [Tuberibacillus sp. Marseille-P3662]|uniref:hypothetical protein n=1 Tax=Tuberibacillus sp. Marseille-P3662 TaxID=1965358 RepID=UPI000A1CA2EC|nr:hypothetical protein [Tuberibacillus sp. Marseille-P3662]